MKINLNSHIMDNRHVLRYALSRFKETEDDYNIFCENIEYSSNLAKTHKINILPYLYILEKIDQHQYESFLMFYKIYLKKSNIDNDPNLENILDYIDEDVVNMITFIVAMQYYFL